MIDKVLDEQGLKYYDNKSKKYIKDEISKVRKYCLVGSDTANTAGWYKVASQTMNGYNDVNITFMITSTYINYYSGILQLHMRSENVSPIICTSLKWHSRIGFDAEDVICVVNGMTYSIYINHRVPQYGRIMFEIISESTINGATTNIGLHNSTAPEPIIPTPTVKATDGAIVKSANYSDISNQVKPTALSNEDLNSLLPDDTTWYYAPGLNTIKNNPFGDGTAFGICIYKNATGYRTQEATSLYGVKKIRYYNNSTWSEWKTFAYGEDYLSLNDGGILKKPLNIQGDVSTNPLQVRSIVGSNGTNTVGELYLQYGANSAIKLGKEGKYTISADGSSYSGNSATATALTSSDGNATTPIYFKDGKPIACTYTLEKSVPSNAVFTDTLYTHPTTSGNKHIPSGGSEGQILSWASDGTAKWSTPVAPGVPGDYLELTGGKLTLEGLRSLTYYRSGTDVYVGHTYESDNGILGAIAMKTVDGGLIRGSSDFSTFYNILDTGNYTNYVLPKSGGTLSGNSINTFAIERTSEFLAGIKFINSNGTLGYIGMAGTPDGGLKRVSADTFSTYTILDENNMGDYVVPKATGGEFIGSISSKGNITSAWLQSTADNASSNKLSKICVQDDAGWIYTRTLEQFANDIGVKELSQSTNGQFTLTNGLKMQWISVPDLEWSQSGQSQVVTTYTFPVAYSDTSYAILISNMDEQNIDGGSTYKGYRMQIVNKTTTGFTMYIYDVSSTPSIPDPSEFILDVFCIGY